MAGIRVLSDSCTNEIPEKLANLVGSVSNKHFDDLLAQLGLRLPYPNPVVGHSVDYHSAILYYDNMLSHHVL